MDYRGRYKIKMSSNKILLWHGTSTLFLSDIQKNGLQNFDINKNYKTIDALKYLLNYIGKKCKNINVLTTEYLNTARSIADQSNASFNFEDNDLFVTNNPYKAAEHAVDNIYGSELLSTAVNVTRMAISMFDKDEYNEFYNDYSKIVNLKYTYAPIVLSFRVNIEPGYMRAEANRDKIISIEDVKKDLKECKESIKNKTYGRFNSYRLMSSVPPENITAYLCIRNEYMKDEDYKFIKLGRLDKIKSTGSISIMN